MKVGGSRYTSMEISMEVGGSRFASMGVVGGSFHANAWKFSLCRWRWKLPLLPSNNCSSQEYVPRKVP